MVVLREIMKQIPNPVMEQFIEVIDRHFDYLRLSPSLGHTREAIKELLTNNDQFYGLLLLNQTGHVIGYLLGETKLVDCRRIYYIAYLYVEPAYRSQGWAKTLLRKIMNQCRHSWGISFILLTCREDNQPAQGLYRKMGFVPDPFQKTIDGYTVLMLQ